MVLVPLSPDPLARTGSQGAPGPEVSLPAQAACGSGQQSWELTPWEQPKCSPLSRVRLSATSWTVGPRLLCPWDSPGGLPKPGIEPGSPTGAAPCQVRNRVWEQLPQPPAYSLRCVLASPRRPCWSWSPMTLRWRLLFLAPLLASFPCVS